MAAPTYRTQLADGVVTVTSAAIQSLAVVAGDIIIAQALQDGTGADMTLSSIHANIANLAGTASSMTSIGAFATGNPTAAKQHLWIGRASANIDVGTQIMTFNSSSGDDFYLLIHAFSGVNTGTTLAAVIENGGSTHASEAGTSATVDDVGVTTNDIDRLACNFIGVNDDNAIGAFAGETGGSWILAADFGSATGTDGEVGLQTAAMASAGTINGGIYNQPSDGWSVVGFALIPAAAAPIVEIMQLQEPRVYDELPRHAAIVGRKF